MKINLKKMNEAERIAGNVSHSSGKPWYVMSKEGYRPVVVSEENLNRYMKNGYTVMSAYLKGKQYKNLYRIEGKLQFVM